MDLILIIGINKVVFYSTSVFNGISSIVTSVSEFGRVDVIFIRYTTSLHSADECVLRDSICTCAFKQYEMRAHVDNRKLEVSQIHEQKQFAVLFCGSVCIT